MHSTRRVLSEAYARRLPVIVGQKCEVKVTCGLIAFGRGFMPGVDETRALAEGVVALRLEGERARRA